MIRSDQKCRLINKNCYNKIMRKKHREKIIDVTTEVLEVLLRIGGATNHAFFDQKSFYNEINSRGYDRKVISNLVGRLINQGHIEAIEADGGRSIRLTRKGNIKLIEKTDDRTTDGKWRFISFDIPEDYRAFRLNLRRSLRRIGYKPLQKSLWVCPFNKADQVELIISELTLGEYCAYFTVEKTDIEEHLKELFDQELE